MRCEIELYFYADKIINHKIDLKEAVKTQLIDDEYFFGNYSYDEFINGNVTEEEVIDIIKETDIDIFMKYINVDEDSLHFAWVEDEDDGILTYKIEFDFDAKSFIYKYVL